jgi:hypothetical protein
MQLTFYQITYIYKQNHFSRERKMKRKGRCALIFAMRERLFLSQIIFMFGFVLESWTARFGDAFSFFFCVCVLVFCFVILEFSFALVYAGEELHGLIKLKILGVSVSEG